MKVLPFERPLGARPSADATTFRVWAPRPERIVLRAGGSDHELADAGLGVREVTLPLPAGQDYAFVIDGVEIPDPASRWQPAGLRGPSRVLDTAAFAWTDDGFTPPALEDTVIYELHVGTFTPEGTFEAVIPHLAGLRELGDHHDRADAGGGVPRPPRLGLRRRLPVGRPLGLRRPARRCSGSSTPPTPRASRSCSTSSTTTSAPPASRRSRRSAPTSRARTRRSGARRSTSTTPTAAASASGCCRAPRAGSATSTSTGCGSTPSTRSSTPAPSTSSRRSPRRVHADRPARARDRRSQA